MKPKIFNTFGEASGYAKDLAMGDGIATKVIRQQSQWIVFVGELPHEYMAPAAREQVPWEIRRQRLEEEDRKRREQQHQEIVQCEKQREELLASKRQRYESMPVEELQELWSRREELEWEDDEAALVRLTLRNRLGIKTAYGHSAKACPTCGMVGENCNCGRSWF